MSPAEWGVVGSSFTVGGLIGALSAGPISSKYGRLRAMQITTVFFALGPLFEALAPHMGVLTLGRVISGFGAGSAMVVVPIYISEISPPAEKGFFGSFTQIMVNFGILITQLLGYFLSKGQFWRIILAVGGVIGVAQGIGLLFSTESPRWTAEQGYSSQAKRTLRKIRGHDANIDEEFSAYGVGDVSESNGTSSSCSYRCYFLTFFDPQRRKRLFSAARKGMAPIFRERKKRSTFSRWFNTQFIAEQSSRS